MGLELKEESSADNEIQLTLSAEERSGLEFACRQFLLTFTNHEASGALRPDFVKEIDGVRNIYQTILQGELDNVGKLYMGLIDMLTEEEIKDVKKELNIYKVDFMAGYFLQKKRELGKSSS